MVARTLGPGVVAAMVVALSFPRGTGAFWFPRGTRVTDGHVVDIRDYGAVAGASDPATAVANVAAVNAALANLSAGDTLLVPEGEFFAVGGIVGTNLSDVTLQVNGSLHALPDFDHWPRQPQAGEVSSSGGGGGSGPAFDHFVVLNNASHVTVRGAPTGCLDGDGKKWWNAEILGMLNGKRPKLLFVSQSTNLLVQDLLLHSSPSFHLMLDTVAEVEVDNVTVITDRREVTEAKALMRTQRRNRDGERRGQQQHPHQHHSMGAAMWDQPEPGLEPEDLNTDGIDPKGRDMWIHHCNILNDDDSIAVKPSDGTPGQGFSSCTENVLVEDMVMTGFGASIGSVPPHPNVNCVRNITFRRISMPRTGKGIYVKSNPSCEDGGTKTTGVIRDILYEDIDILEPSWWPIWIGPQQQHEPNKALGEKCALAYPIVNTCPTQGCVSFTNITLRNIYIEDPHMSPGVILGNVSNPMQQISFTNVTVRNPGSFPFHHQYQCEFADVVCVDCDPAPNCTTTTA